MNETAQQPVQAPAEPKKEGFLSSVKTGIKEGAKRIVQKPLDAANDLMIGAVSGIPETIDLANTVASYATPGAMVKRVATMDFAPPKSITGNAGEKIRSSYGDQSTGSKALQTVGTLLSPAPFEAGIQAVKGALKVPSKIENAMFKTKPVLQQAAKVEAPKEINLDYLSTTPLKDVATIEKELGTTKGVPKTYKEIKSAVDMVAPKPKDQPLVERLLAELDNSEKTVLSQAHGEEVLPYNVYAKSALETSPATGTGKGATALDLFGGQAIKASNKLQKVTSDAGAALGDIEARASEKGVANSDFFDTRGIKQNLVKELQSKLGLGIGENGELVPYAGMNPKDAVNVQAANKIKNEILKLNDEETAENVNSAIRNIRGYIEEPKKSQLKPTTSATDNVAKNLEKYAKDELYKYVERQLPGEAQRFKTLRGNYAELKKNAEVLSDLLGREISYTDESGNVINTTAKGASLGKRLVGSNADSGAKANAEFIKNVTGIDLWKNAKFATTAMKAAGDPRSLDLLKSMDVLVDMKTGGAFSMAKKAASKLLPSDRLKASVDYYNRFNKK